MPNLSFKTLNHKLNEQLESSFLLKMILYFDIFTKKLTDSFKSSQGKEL